MIILGIETSCDETAAAVVNGRGGKVEVLSNVISSQVNIHKKYGGVVPEVAAREHILNILPAVNEALLQAGIKREEAAGKIKAIAVTVGPGLITSLMAGAETAKALSYGWRIPVIGINHIEGHIYANFINKNSKLSSDKKLSCRYPELSSLFNNFDGKFPILVLTVSGGHTMLVLMRGHGRYETIGETRDDAAGEAFDKAGKILGLGYPGGPAVSARADKLRAPDKSKIKLPRPMIGSPDYDFSFSGLKTALLYEARKDSVLLKSRKTSQEYKRRVSEYCYEFQQAVIDVLIGKTVKAARGLKVKTIMLAGGVSANKKLRAQLQTAVKNQLSGTESRMPDLKYTTDNAAMIAAAGYFKAREKKYTPWNKLKVDCNAEL